MIMVAAKVKAKATAMYGPRTTPVPITPVPKRGECRNERVTRAQATGSAGSSSGGSPSQAILSIRDVARQVQLDPSNPRWAKGTVGLEEDPMDRTALDDFGHAIIASVTAR